MKKIRINELARELEVKAHEILDRLPELGVTEKKTHSSSIDEDVAIKLRRLYGFEENGGSTTAEEEDVDLREDYAREGAEEERPEAESPAAPAAKLESATGSAPVAAESKAESEPERQPEVHHMAPIRPPLA